MKYYFIGTDEAGYGPNLGPLSVSASLWSADFPKCDDPLSSLNRRGEACLHRKEVFRICDSKKLCHSGRILPLERSFFYAYEKSILLQDELPLFRGAISPEPPRCPDWKAVIETLSVAHSAEKKFRPPWEKESVFPLPLTETEYWKDEFCRDYEESERCFQEAGITLLRIANRRVQPQEFNQAVDRIGLKSELLASVTMEVALSLIRPLIAECGNDRVEIFLCCDKLGGRNRYGDLLTCFFPEMMFQIETESRPLSRYSFPLRRGGFTVLFQAKGESNLPSAMASIVSKYTREISMKAFNEYWKKRVPDLEPTAGYPVDAKRFLEETQSERERLGIDNDLFWRKK